MRLLRRLVLLTAAGTAVLCQRSNLHGIVDSNTNQFQAHFASSNRQSELVARDATAEVLMDTLDSIQRRQIHSGSPRHHLSELPIHTKRSAIILLHDRSPDIEHSMTLSPRALREQTLAPADLVLHRRDVNSDYLTTTSSLVRRGQCFSWLCGKEKDIHKLDPPYGPAPARSPSQSVIHESPFARYGPNAGSDSGGSVGRLTSSTSGMDHLASTDTSGLLNYPGPPSSVTSPTSSMPRTQSLDDSSGSSSSPRSHLDLMRSRNSDEMTREFNSAYSALWSKSGKYTPGLQGRRPTLGDSAQASTSSSTQGSGAGSSRAAEVVKNPQTSKEKGPAGLGPRLPEKQAKQRLTGTSPPTSTVKGSLSEIDRMGLRSPWGGDPTPTKAMPVGDKKSSHAPKESVAEQPGSSEPFPSDALPRTQPREPGKRSLAIARTLASVHLGTQATLFSAAGVGISGAGGQRAATPAINIPPKNPSSARSGPYAGKLSDSVGSLSAAPGRQSPMRSRQKGSSTEATSGRSAVRDSSPSKNKHPLRGSPTALSKASTSKGGSPSAKTKAKNG